MNYRPRTAMYFFMSLFLSVLLHLIIYSVSDKLAFSAFAYVPTDEGKKKPLTVRIYNPRDLVMRPSSSRITEKKTTEELRKVIRARHLELRKLLEAEHIIEKPRPRLRLTGLGSPVLTPKIEPPKPRELQAPLPEIVEIDAAKLKPERMALRESQELRPKLARKNVPIKHVPSLVSGSDFQEAVPKTYDVSMRLGLPSMKSLRVNPLPPFSEEEGREGSGGVRLSPTAALPPPPSVGPGLRRGSKAEEIEQLDRLLDVSFVVYPLPDGGGYFRADITPNPRAERLPSLPKDVLFLIDCSTSISQPKLEQFKAAVSEALEYLNPVDRFNVVSFNTRPRPLFPFFTPVTPQNVEAARAFLRTLVRGGMTDIYASLAPFVGTDRPPDRPLNIFLLSDGKTTVEDSPRNADLIRRIVQLNRANVSIYSFSAGRSANLYVLDLLAYNNRGKSLHEEQLSDFRRQLVRFISTHADLIVADLEYHVTGGLGDEVYPKRLPHIYRGETLSVYGRYPAGVRELALSIVGRGLRGRIEELIFRTDLSKAPRASSRLAVEWASQKLFHLISEYALRPSPDLYARIRALSAQYKLYVPYL